VEGFGDKIITITPYDEVPGKTKGYRNLKSHMHGADIVAIR
jgi:hypothetical protein